MDLNCAELSDFDIPWCKVNDNKLVSIDLPVDNVRKTHRKDSRSPSSNIFTRKSG